MLEIEFLASHFTAAKSLLLLTFAKRMSRVKLSFKYINKSTKKNKDKC